MPSFGKRNAFGLSHLKPFEKVFGKKADGTSKRNEGEWSFTKEDEEKTLGNSRWRCFSREFISDKKDDSLDLTWIKDEDSIDIENLPDPSILAAEAMNDLVEGLRELKYLMIELGEEEAANAQIDLLVNSLGIEEDK